MFNDIVALLTALFSESASEIKKARTECYGIVNVCVNGSFSSAPSGEFWLLCAAKHLSTRCAFQ